VGCISPSVGNKIPPIRFNNVVFPLPEGALIIFQQPQLLPYLTAEENIILPLSSFLTEEKARRIAQKHLQEMEMEPFGNRYPKELSYGQQQRIAIYDTLPTDESEIRHSSLVGIYR